MAEASSLKRPADPLPTWCAGLDKLLDSKLITGYTLVTARGIAFPAAGPLETVLSGQDGVGLSPCAEQFLAPFNAPGNETTTFEILGQKCLVIHQTDTSIYALSRRRRLGLAVIHVPLLGVLVVTFGHATHPPVALSHIERCCQRLR